MITALMICGLWHNTYLGYESETTKLISILNRKVFAHRP